MKKFIALFLALALLAAMTACGGNGNNETTTADNNVTTTTVGGADETTTTVADQTTTTVEDGNEETTTLPTTDPTGETTTTDGQNTTVSETTTTVSETTTTTPDGTTSIFNSAWGPWDTYDVNTGERYTASVFRDNAITLTYTTTVTCSICKSFMKSYMNQLSDELEKRDGEVIVVIVFAAEHYNEQKIADIIVEYKEWYKANKCEFTFIVADDFIQTKRPSGVPYINIWVGGKFGGEMKMQVHGASSGSPQREQYDTLLNAVDFWLAQL